MDLRAAKFFGRDDFVRHGLHDVGAGHEHVGRVAHHEDEVGHRRRIDVAAGARAHDDADLRDDAGREHVAGEDFAVAASASTPSWMRAPPASNTPMTGRAVAERHVLDLDDLLRVGRRERAAEDGEVLDEHIDEAAVDRAPAGDDAVAGDAGRLHAEIGRAVFDEGVEFLERAFVEQDVDALARGQLAAGVLGLDALFAAAHVGRGAAPFELADDVVHRPIAPGGR